MMLANDKITGNNDAVDRTETARREAKRIACIAESMNIIRTLNSNTIPFKVDFSLDGIFFTIQGLQFQLLQMKTRELSGDGYAKEYGNWTAISFRW